jgi:uncharacterized protein (TIGR02001 family)
MTELYVAASWNAATLKYSHAMTNANGVERSVGSNYLDLTVTTPLTNNVSVLLHAGRQSFRGRTSLAELLGTTNDSFYTYNDYSVGLSATLGNAWNASVLYTTTSARDAGYVVQGRNIGSPQVAVGFLLNF